MTTTTTKTIAEREAILVRRIRKFADGPRLAPRLRQTVPGGYYYIMQHPHPASSRWENPASRRWEDDDAITLTSTPAMTLEEAEQWAETEDEVRDIAFRVVRAVADEKDADFLVWRYGKTAAALQQNAFPLDSDDELYHRGLVEMALIAPGYGWELVRGYDDAPVFIPVEFTNHPSR
jgi:hypothetical protein